MRSPFISTLVLLACSAFATAAHADTFSFAFTPTGGTTDTSTIDGNSPSWDRSGNYIYWSGNDVQGSSTGYKNITLYSPSVYGSYGYGPLDLYWSGATAAGFYSGVQLFSTVNGVDTPLSGTYQLAGNQALGYGKLSATLVITDLTTQVNTAATPEPSSLILLGTGLMGAAGMARRRFFTA